MTKKVIPSILKLFVDESKNVKPTKKMDGFIPLSSIVLAITKKIIIPKFNL